MAPNRRLNQKRLDNCSSVTWLRCTVAEESPKSLSMLSTPVIAVTIPTSPKSFGLSKRANTTIEPMRTTKLIAWAPTRARPPRSTVSVRSLMHSTLAGLKPKAHAGLLEAPHVAELVGHFSPRVPGCEALVVAPEATLIGVEKADVAHVEMPQHEQRHGRTKYREVRI